MKFLQSEKDLTLLCNISHIPMTFPDGEQKCLRLIVHVLIFVKVLDMYVFALFSVLSKIVPFQEVNDKLKRLANFAFVL